MSGQIVFWQPEAGKLPVHVGELIGDSDDDVSLSRRVKRWGHTEVVPLKDLRGQGLEYPEWLDDLAAAFGLPL